MSGEESEIQILRVRGRYEEGLEDGRRQMAKTRLQKNLDLNLVQEVTGLTLEQIRSLL